MDVNAPGCSMLSTHDDFSIVSMLPSDVAVLTHLRDPVDRVLSAYEFAVEVGSRHASRPAGAGVKKAANKIATDEVWPWSSLVPFMAEDVRRRRAVGDLCPPSAVARGVVTSNTQFKTMFETQYNNEVRDTVGQVLEDLLDARRHVISSSNARARVRTRACTHTYIHVRVHAYLPMHLSQAAASSSSSPPIQPHHWVHVTHPDGSQYYYNKVRHTSPKRKVLPWQ